MATEKILLPTSPSAFRRLYTHTVILAQRTCSRLISVTRKCKFFFKFLNFYKRHAVPQLVEALRYRPEGRGFDSLWHFCPKVDSAFHISEEQEYYLGVKAARV